MALTVASVVLLVVSGYLPWMAPASDATQVPSIGSYLFGYKLTVIESIFVGVMTVASGITLVLPWNQVKGGVLCLLGVGYAVLPHYLIAQQSASLPQVFEPVMVGPALASVAGCLAVAAGAFSLRGSVEAR
ncbi:hypothetical protein ACFQH8_15030 [Halomicroarcula sp. GCM10025710]